MPIGILSKTLAALLEMDHLDTKIYGDRVVYTFKTTSLFRSTTEIKSKILSVLDFPVDIPQDVNIRLAKQGVVTKEYVVDITVHPNKIGTINNLLARKYSRFRDREYRR